MLLVALAVLVTAPPVDHTDAWIQAVLGPLVMLVIGYALNVTNKRRTKRLSQKVDDVTAQVASTKSGLGDQITATRKEVTNEHPRHLRDDIDDIKAANADIIVRLDTQSSQLALVFEKQKNQEVRDKRRDTVVDKLGRALVGLRDDVTQLVSHDTQHYEDSAELKAALNDLEKTLPKGKLPPTRS